MMLNFLGIIPEKKRELIIMELELLIKSALGLVAVLVVLVFLFVVPSQMKGKPKKVKSVSPAKKQEAKTDLKSLAAIINHKNTSAKTLQTTLNLVIQHHGIITNKLGTRTHPDFDIYMGILVAICRHPHTSKDIIMKFNKELERLNPKYKKDIQSTTSNALDSRG